MKLLLFDFLCPKCGTFEDLAKSDVRYSPCPRCQSPAPRQISAVRIDRSAMALSDSATPTSIDHFERVHRQRRAIEDKHYAEHGDYGTHAGSDGGSPVTPEIAQSL